MKHIDRNHPAARALARLPVPTSLDVAVREGITRLNRMSHANLGIPGRDRPRELRENGVTLDVLHDPERACYANLGKLPKYRMDPRMRRANNNMPHQHPVAPAVPQFTAAIPLTHAERVKLLLG